MVTVQIHYTQVYGQVGYDSVQRQSGQVTRTMCLPFSPVGVQCRLSKDGMLLFRGAAGAAVQEGNGRGGEGGGRGAQEESREEGGGGGGSKMLYRLSAQDMHLVDRVLLQMDSITVCPLGSESAVDERLAPRRLTRPYAVNLCASCACIEGHGRAELTEGCKRLGIAKVERMNINRGTTISSVLCKVRLSCLSLSLLLQPSMYPHRLA